MTCDTRGCKAVATMHGFPFKGNGAIRHACPTHAIAFIGTGYFIQEVGKKNAILPQMDFCAECERSNGPHYSGKCKH